MTTDEQERYAQAWADGSGESVETAAFGPDFIRARAEELAELRAALAGYHSLAWGWNGHPDDPDPQQVAPDWYQVLDADECEVDIEVDASELVAEVLRRQAKASCCDAWEHTDESLPADEVLAMKGILEAVHPDGPPSQPALLRVARRLWDEVDRLRDLVELLQPGQLPPVALTVSAGEAGSLVMAYFRSMLAELRRRLGVPECAAATWESALSHLESRLTSAEPSEHREQRAWETVGRMKDEGVELADVTSGSRWRIELLSSEYVEVVSPPTGECRERSHHTPLQLLERFRPAPASDHRELTRLAERLLRIEALLLDPAELSKEPAEALERLRQMPGGAPLQLGRLAALEDAVRQTAELGDGLKRIATALEQLVSSQDPKR